MNTENAVIGETFLGYEDHGIFTAYIQLRGSGWVQSFGGYSLDTYDEEEKKRVSTAFAGDWITSVLNTLKVPSWEKVRGQAVRMRSDGQKIVSIGHLIDDKWFDPTELLEKYQGKKDVENP